MLFRVLTAGQTPARDQLPHFRLYEDNWNDWYEYKTQYQMWFQDENGDQYVGSLKIGQTDMQKGQERPAIPMEFDALDNRFFSLGQTDTYYENIKFLGSDIRERTFVALRDLAYDEVIYESAMKEPVTHESLLRSVTDATVRGQFHRIAHGGARLTKFNFDYETRAKQTLPFLVTPHSVPPTNIHVLIGNNGVGKTTLLNSMTRSLVEEDPNPDEVGRFLFHMTDPRIKHFANVVSVSFSAFDPFVLVNEPDREKRRVKYSYIGIHEPISKDNKSRKPKDSDKLASEFANSLSKCRQSQVKFNKWCRAYEILESDAIFAASDLSRLTQPTDQKESAFLEYASSLFRPLSSGHKIVLLTVTRLVEKVEECTLVLLDEPEAHLHPPFLSAFIRTLSDLLIDRNGVAIIATHSPVVLQEVPKSCVWKIRRVGDIVNYEQPDIETFGENVGILTQDVFRLEVTKSGFYTLLRQYIEESQNYRTVLSKFDGQLGAEARAIVRALFADLENRKDRQD